MLIWLPVTFARARSGGRMVTVVPSRRPRSISVRRVLETAAMASGLLIVVPPGRAVRGNPKGPARRARADAGAETPREAWYGPRSARSRPGRSSPSGVDGANPQTGTRTSTGSRPPGPRRHLHASRRAPPQPARAFRARTVTRWIPFGLPGAVRGPVPLGGRRRARTNARPRADHSGAGWVVVPTRMEPARG